MSATTAQPPVHSVVRAASRYAQRASHGPWWWSDDPDVLVTWEQVAATGPVRVLRTGLGPWLFPAAGENGARS